MDETSSVQSFAVVSTTADSDLEKECNALNNLFQQIVSEMKVR